MNEGPLTPSRLPKAVGLQSTNRRPYGHMNGRQLSGAGVTPLSGHGGREPAIFLRTVAEPTALSWKSGAVCTCSCSRAACEWSPASFAASSRPACALRSSGWASRCREATSRLRPPLAADHLEYHARSSFGYDPAETGAAAYRSLWGLPMPGSYPSKSGQPCLGLMRRGHGGRCPDAFPRTRTGDSRAPTRSCRSRRAPMPGCANLTALPRSEGARPSTSC
jgi:hypothetical protein